MLKKIKILHKFIIPEWSACYFANGDDSGLDQKDFEDIKNFETKLIKKYGNAELIVQAENSLGFCHYNDINSYGSDCIQAILFEETTR